MSRENIATIVKILESLPDSQQEGIIDHLREYIADSQDEWQWNQSFEKTQSKLVEAARQAKQQIAQGQAQPMDYEQL
ncbi:hypothetical protein [Argonema antarcticum]|uniref:hypothetical protein n=1 Tax=Argonema antarcticum TaxID=2942763 RepID=UPI002011F490|nr:hypothetical protein [Argonema antarcticum]MCL1472668.1 hypothetical protein [Argonema antarcticum A004/B2]